ncbi:MAG: cyclohydrolase [Bryobacterales bacterium]|jgi:7-cyano-7-deazaguanine reductase|nr:cyclohydrolase [Bryobacterales bacterium]
MKNKAYTDEHAASGILTELPGIETWPNQFGAYEIEIGVPEFTSVCPKTGLPDSGTIVVTYVPDKLCLELKSFKMYTLAYRNVGIFQENIVNCFVRDIVAAAKPLQITVTGEFAPRGGLTSRITATWEKSQEKKHRRDR